MKFFNQTKQMCLIMLLLIMASSCTANKMGDKYRDYFANESAVDFSDLLNILHQSENDAQYNLSEALLGDNHQYTERMLVFNDNSFAVELPQYATSQYAFLANAEDFYNACLLQFNIWSNHELWFRVCDGYEHAETERIVAGINAMSENCIKDDSLRMAALTFKTEIVRLMERDWNDWDEDENSISLLMDYGTQIDRKAVQFYADVNQFVDSLTELNNELISAKQPIFEQYLQCESDSRLEFILNALNDCETFDEQCSLFLNWANSQEAEQEDGWVIAVAERLMKSGHYNPFLYKVWMIWRCLFQCEYCGMSRDSCIPDDLYNDMRRRCYITSLAWVENHPNDVFAMNSAASIGGRANIGRYSQYVFGNDAAVEKLIHLPGRYEGE